MSAPSASLQTAAPPRASVAQRIFLALLVLVVTAFALLSLWFGGRAAWATAQTLSARWLVGQWRYGEGPAATEERWEQTLQTLQQAVQSGPANADLHADIGFLHAARAQEMGSPAADTEDAQLQQRLWDEAIVHYRAATTLRPTYPYGWAYLAMSKHFRGQHDAEMWAALDKGLAHGVNEGGVQQALATVAFAHWASLGPQRQGVIAGMVRQAHANVRPGLQTLAQRYGVVLPDAPGPAP